MVRPSFRFSSAFLVTLAVLLALFHAVLAVTATQGKSMTSDEIAHLVAGHAYNVRGDFRLQPENGNLPQRLAALPMSAAGVPLPPVTHPEWEQAEVWKFGHTFFYRWGISADFWLFAGRGMIALVSAATGLLIFFWSKALFGWSGGFVSLLLFVFCPTFLAHGALATSDLVMTFFFLASVGAWWRHLERPGFLWATLSAVSVGLAFVAKFSAVLLPFMLGLAAVAWWYRQAGARKAAALRVLRSTAMHIAVAWLIIWACYDFRYSAFSRATAVARFTHGWEWILPGLGAPSVVILWLRDAQLLPEAWLYGLTFVLQFSKARGAFMSGEYSVTGWPSFFPFAFAVKTPLPLLVLIGGGVVAFTYRLRQRWRAGRAELLARLWPWAPLAALFGVYWATSITSQLNIGHRHILPTYPVLFIATGWFGRWLARPWGPGAVAVGLLLAWQVIESQRIRPHYLAYFNQLVGGAGHGYRHLVDSSLDWGQDLPGLKAWLEQNQRGERVYLSYFGTGDPGYEGIEAVALPSLPEVGAPRRWHALGGGIYAISATMLQHAYSRVRGPWTAALESEFQDLRPLEPLFLEFQRSPERRRTLLADAPHEKWIAGWNRYEQLRFARLCHGLRAREPDAHVGFSILIYRLSDADVAEATQSDLAGWRNFIERSAKQR